MLHTLEQEAAHYGMSLNHKTELMLNPAFPEPRWTFRHGDAEARRLLQKAVQLRNNADKKQKGEVKFDRMIGCGSDLRREPHFNS
eukprot:s3313_g2.t1